MKTLEKTVQLVCDSLFAAVLFPLLKFGTVIVAGLIVLALLLR